MDKAKEIFEVLLRVASVNGSIMSAHLYSDDFITIEGESDDGKKFTLSFRKEEKNA